MAEIKIAHLIKFAGPPVGPLGNALGGSPQTPHVPRPGDYNPALPAQALSGGQQRPLQAQAANIGGALGGAVQGIGRPPQAQGKQHPLQAQAANIGGAWGGAVPGIVSHLRGIAQRLTPGFLQNPPRFLQNPGAGAGAGAGSPRRGEIPGFNMRGVAQNPVVPTPAQPGMQLIPNYQPGGGSQSLGLSPAR